MHRSDKCTSSAAAPLGENDAVVLPSFRKFARIATKLRELRYARYVNKRCEMPAREDMDLCTDKVLSKERILRELTKAVKLVSRKKNACCSVGRQGRRQAHSVKIHGKLERAVSS